MIRYDMQIIWSTARDSFNIWYSLFSSFVRFDFVTFVFEIFKTRNGVAFHR